MATSKELRRKLHDLANQLEAISLGRRFVERNRKTGAALDQLIGGIESARKSAMAMNALLQEPLPAARRKTASKRPAVTSTR